jgi:TonB-linked SusC/RagA family outer membrane protein
MRKTLVLLALLGAFFWSAPAFAQQKMVTGKVTGENGTPLVGVSIIVKGTATGTLSNNEGAYSIQVSPGQVLQFSFIGAAAEERTVGAADVINVQLRSSAITLDAVVVTALGQTSTQRALGTSQQMVQGTAIAGTQRENFINSIQGRVSGVEVTSTSGVPGASSSIVIRGVSSISSSNQPLIIIDGIPVSNSTFSTNALASGTVSGQDFANRGLDFTNRAADFNPEDIETLTVLKGAGASALYGIDAANGAIVITTKSGKAGRSGLEYSNSFRVESIRGRPETQHVYGPTAQDGTNLFYYFGSPYADGTQFYDNISGFFQTRVTQKHNLAFSGATGDSRISYRLAASMDDAKGVVPSGKLTKLNLTGKTNAQVTNWLKADLSMQYMNSNNDQPLKGAGGPLIGLLIWPDTISAKDYLTPGGLRRRLTTLSAGSEIDNPYFSVQKNRNHSETDRVVANLGITLMPFSFGYLQARAGADNVTTQLQILRHPESATGFTFNGFLDEANVLERNVTTQVNFNFNRFAITDNFAISGVIGHEYRDDHSITNSVKGQDFLDPYFVSINNAAQKTPRTVTSQRRIMGAYGQATLEFNNYLFFTASGRNDWTSTIPKERNSFFYPAFNAAFVFSDAFPAIGNFMSGKLRLSAADAGKDARPYAFQPALENKVTSYGGYGYGFTGPNYSLKPEFKREYEIGTELAFFDGRLGVDAAVYRNERRDQIVNDIRGSYGTGFILFNLNGAKTRNEGMEISLRGTPITNPDFSWDVLANFGKARGKVLALPAALPESYVSDTWLYGNVRNGTGPGLSTMSLTGMFYLRNKNGDLLIEPTTGLPVRSSTFIDAGYDRQPDFTIGLTNTFRYKRLGLDFLLDIRKGGDVFNATEHYLTARGLSMRTLDREKPRVIKGVLRDGKENTDNPTPNNIVVIPAIQTGYYTGISEELFIEKDINWLRLRDITLSYKFPQGFLSMRSASAFVTATDVFLLTNYSGMDPIVNGNSAAVGGSGGVGIDYGNFPMPRGVNFGFKVGF